MKKKIIFELNDSDIEIFKKLDWKNPIEEQKEAIEYIRENKDLKLNYLAPPYLVVCWDNAADVLHQLGFDRTKGITYELLEWQQDFFWPGADTIRRLLYTFPNDHLIPYFEKAIKEAYDHMDDEWLYNLGHFIRINKISRNDFRDKNLYAIVTNKLEECMYF